MASTEKYATYTRDGVTDLDYAMKASAYDKSLRTPRGSITINRLPP